VCPSPYGHAGIRRWCAIVLVPSGSESVKAWPARADLNQRKAGFHQLQSLLVQKKIFWMIFMLLGLAADFLLPFWLACAATIPILFVAWWIAYRSDWF